MTVRIYMPASHRSYLPDQGAICRVMQEFLVHGETTLVELRDRISCQEDYQDVAPDCSENPTERTHRRSGEKYRSALFFLGNHFYIDTRYESEDYSSTIRAWGESKNIVMGETKLMDNVSICDLKIRLGYPYVYIHQGGCEHLVVFTDARLLHIKDNDNVLNYPIMTSFSSLKGRMCSICLALPSKYIVSNCEDLLYDHTYLCTTCTIMYNYEGRRKAKPFTLKKYTDRVALL